MKIRGAIFDMDGTVLDSMPVWENLTARFLSPYNITLTGADREAMEGATQFGVAQYVAEKYPRVPLDAQAISDGMDRLIEERYRALAIPKKGVLAFLEQLRAEGIPCAIATLTDKKHARRVLEELDMLKYFPVILNTQDVGVSKRKPHLYLEAARQIGCTPESCMVFEDAPYAAQTARDAGFQVCGIEEPAYAAGRDELHQAAHVLVRESYDEIHTYVFGPGKTLPVALTIAGSDSSGGAGIQADLKTFTALGIYGESCLTAITAQNTMGVQAIHNIPAEVVKAQIDAVFADIPPAAVKIGMVSSAAIIEVIAEKMRTYRPKYLVVDPVMISTSGSKLLSDDAMDALVDGLMPLATLVTPNIPEAEALTGIRIESRDDMPAAAQAIAARTGGAVLLKGGHLPDLSDDLLLVDGQAHWTHGAHIPNNNTHGTGCTLSSAIAAYLARGMALKDAVHAAKKYVTDAILWRLNLGQGNGPLCHMARQLKE